jgi:hypothetical protein
MIPLKEQWVKVFFRNSMQAEGYVEFWSEEQAVLRADEGLSLLIIQDVKADIMAVKVYTYPDAKKPNEPKITDERAPLDEEFEKVKRETQIDEYLKAKTLLELRKLQAEQDRKIISERLKDHTPTSQVKVPKYELPGFLKK